MKRSHLWMAAVFLTWTGVAGAAEASLTTQAQAEPSAPVAETTPDPSNPNTWLARLNPHCGSAYAGRVTVDEPAGFDAVWAEQPIVLYLRSCERAGRVLQVTRGENRSMVWLVGVSLDGLLLRRGLYEPDGLASAQSGDEGIARALEDDKVIEFAANESTRERFKEDGQPERADAVWSFTLTDDTLIYDERWSGRHLRVEFDLRTKVDPPLLPWFESPII